MSDRRLDITAAPFNADPSGVASSVPAWRAVVDTANLMDHGATIYVPPGRYKIDEATNRVVRAGVAIEGEWTGPAVGYDMPLTATTYRRDYGRRGAVIEIRDYDGCDVTPWITFANGSGIRNINFTQPDQDFTLIYPEAPFNAVAVGGGGDDGGLAYVTRLYQNLDYSEDERRQMESTIDGGPKVYAPCIQFEFSDILGHHQNAGRMFIHNIGLLGVYDGISGLDNFPALDGSAGHQQKGSSDLIIDGLRGYCLHTTCLFAQGGVMTYVDNVRMSPGYFFDAGGLDPLQRGLRWAKRNGTMFWVKNRAVGLSIGRTGVHGARYGLRVSGGHTDIGGEYRGLISGRYNQGAFNMGLEECPTAIRFDDDGFGHQLRLSIGGHCKDLQNPWCTDPCIDVRSDGRIAGNMSHDLDGDGIREFKLAGGVNGWRLDIDNKVQECAGSWLRIGAHDPHDLYKMSGNLGSWGNGDPSLPAVQMLTDGDAVSHAEIKVCNMEFAARLGAGQTVFDVPSKENLHVIGSTFIGCGDIVPPASGISYADPEVFVGCRRRQRGWEAGFDTEASEYTPASGSNTNGSRPYSVPVSEGTGGPVVVPVGGGAIEVNPGYTFDYGSADNTPDYDGVPSRAVIMPDDNGPEDQL